MLRSEDSLRGSAVRALQGAACITGLGALSYATRTPFLIPPLGATAFLLVARPSKPAASPRNTVYGHTIAAAAGWLSLWVLGLHGQQMGLANGCDAPHIFSAALALALTTFLMLTLKIVHPPAGATTLIVAIGLLPHAWQVPLVGVSALLLSLEARVLQRVAGQSLPWWSAQYAAPRNDDVAGDAPVDEANAA